MWDHIAQFVSYIRQHHDIAEIWAALLDLLKESGHLLILAGAGLYALIKGFRKFFFQDIKAPQHLVENTFDIPDEGNVFQRIARRIFPPFKPSSFKSKVNRRNMRELAWKAFRGKKNGFDVWLTVRARIEQDIIAGTLGKRLVDGHLWSPQAEEIYCKKDEVRTLQVAQVDLLTRDTVKNNIDRYFKALLKERPDRAPEFLSYTEIESGFIAPLILLGGLLAYMESKWGSIIREYGNFTRIATYTIADEVWLLPQLRKLQAFLFDCWLIWGPSIPICGKNCPANKPENDIDIAGPLQATAGDDTDVEALQYGFGDENSSVIVVAENAHGIVSFGNHASFHAKIKGRLKYAGPVSEEKGRKIVKIHNETQYPKPLVQAIKAQPERLILDLRTRDKHPSGELTIKPQSTNSNYYSAYLWVMFALIEVDGAGTKRLIKRSSGDNKQLWEVLFPFFEHGNLADVDTYGALKKQLARKAIDTIYESNQAQNWDKLGLRFAYVCSIDDAGCNHRENAELIKTASAHPDSKPGGSIRQEIERALSEKYSDQKDWLVDFAYHEEKINMFSACRLPEIIANFYQIVEAIGDNK